MQEKVARLHGSHGEVPASNFQAPSSSTSSPPLAVLPQCHLTTVMLQEVWRFTAMRIASAYHDPASPTRQASTRVSTHLAAKVRRDREDACKHGFIAT